MVGQTIRVDPSFPWRTLLALAAALLLLGVAAATATAHWAIAAILPGVLAVLWWLFRQRGFQAELTETALEIGEPPHRIAYADIQALQARRPANPYKTGPRSYPIRVIHRHGVVRIPGGLNVPSDEVYSFLYHRLSSTGSRDVDPALAKYLRDKQRQYGEQQVWTFVARKHRGGGPLSIPWLLLWLGCLATGVLWGSLGIALSEPAWVAVGILVGAMGGLWALGQWAKAQGMAGALVKGKHRPSLVICPDGLALAQGDLVGQLRWDEIRKVRLAGGMINLKLDGADIAIADAYDRPLPLIRQLLGYYYDGGKGADLPAWQFDAARLRDTAPDPDDGRYVARPDNYRS